MAPREARSGRSVDFLWIALSLLVLPVCLYYPYVTSHPAVDFQLDRDWNVVVTEPCPPGRDCLQTGDRILAIDELEAEAFARDRTLEWLAPFEHDEHARVRLIRDGRVRTIDVRVEKAHFKILDIDNLAVFFPLVFWLLGTAVVISLRPRDERWLVLVLFSYVTAIWLASGLASSRRTDGSAVVFHVFVWLFLPLTVHLHAILPNSLLGKWRWALLGPLYGLALTLVVLDASYLLGEFDSSYMITVVAGIVFSLGLLLLRVFLPLDPAVKLANRIMLYGLALGFGPLIFLYIFVPLIIARISFTADHLQPFYPWAFSISVLAIPIAPLSYVYAIYKHHLGALEFRANRLLGVYSFSALYVTLYVVILFFVSSRLAPVNERSLAATIATSLAFVAGAPFLRSRFQAFVDRYVFGIRHAPEEVIAIVSDRIPSAFDREVLAKVVVDEILPTLLVRQSALYLFDEAGLEVLYEQGVPAGEPRPSAAELCELLAASGRYLGPHPRREGPRCWVRLVIPLAVKAETIGAWLIGRRDPDDFYPVTDIHLLSTVANQVAPAVENVRLYERAQQEIAQRKLAEAEIRRSEERFRNLFEATLEGIAIVRNGVILEVNHALLAIFGHEPDELIGRPFAELVPDGEAGLSGVPRETRGLRRGGTEVDIEVAGKKYVFQGEDVTVVAVRDIARRKRDEAENRRLQRQLLHSQKMEAIGRLSAGVAHDFNNCLLAIFGYADLLLDLYREDELLARNLAGIKEAGQKAAALTKQLLAFARRQPMERRVVDLNQVVAGVEKMLRRLIGEDVALALDLHPELPRIKIDPGQMEQVVVNLAVNARHAMPGGGRLTVETEPVVVGGGSPPPHANLPEGCWVLLAVTDTGVGMDPETQARVFEPFFSTREAGEGTGLGLSTAYGTVKQSGGHIFVDSVPGEGTRFSIYLPATADEPATDAEPGAALSETGTETILLVEDEEKVRSVVLRILSGRGYRMLEARSGDEAIALAAGYDGPVHLLLTDVTMPAMKGPELAARLLAGRPEMRVLYMSGYNDEDLPSNGAAAPACLQKPFSAQTLARAVRAVLDSSRSGAPA